MEKIKIAYLLGSLKRGGAEMLMLDTMRKHRFADFSMIGIHRKGGELQDDFEKTGVPFYCINPQERGLIRYLLALRHLLKKEKVTHIHAQQTIDGLYGWLASRGMGIKVMITFHGFDIGCSKLDKMRRRILIRLVDKVVFVSKYEMCYYSQHYSVNGKGVVVYNGIDFSKMPKPRNADDLEKNLNKMKLCMVGSFGEGRSHIVVCKALRKLKDDGIEPTFYFIGGKRNSEPEIYDQCCAYCKDSALGKVHFLGNRSDVYELLQEMDGFVYSTVHDTFGIAVVEALSMGLPTLVNDWGVMKEIAIEEASPLYYTTNDVDDLVDKIKELHRAIPNADKIRATYSIEKYIKKLDEIYQ